MLREEIAAAQKRLDKEKGNDLPLPRWLTVTYADVYVESRKKAKAKLEAKMAQDDEARRKGEVMTCACCFVDDIIVSDTTFCSADSPHFFCLDCARRNAENDIGNEKYALRCMDQSKCEYTFSREQRLRFLDKTTIVRLEKLQQQDEIRQAGLEALAHCPFCDFAMICPDPVEVDKEFRCQNSECQKISCRLCNLESHLPKTCLENKMEKGPSQRRIIEEARTEAILRTCKKCGVRFLKDEGCNKVICTKCGAVTCDYCGADISDTTYKHFKDSGQIGLDPNGCPLFHDNTKRREEQADTAGQEAMAKIRAEHPDLTEEELRIKFSDEVTKASHPGRGPNDHAHGGLPDYQQMLNAAERRNAEQMRQRYAMLPMVDRNALHLEDRIQHWDRVDAQNPYAGAAIRQALRNIRDGAGDVQNNPGQANAAANAMAQQEVVQRINQQARDGNQVNRAQPGANVPGYIEGAVQQREQRYAIFRRLQEQRRQLRPNDMGLGPAVNPAALNPVNADLNAVQEQADQQQRQQRDAQELAMELNRNNAVLRDPMGLQNNFPGQYPHNRALGHDAFQHFVNEPLAYGPAPGPRYVQQAATYEGELYLQHRYRHYLARREPGQQQVLRIPGQPRYGYQDPGDPVPAAPQAAAVRNAAEEQAAAQTGGREQPVVIESESEETDEPGSDDVVVRS